MLPVLVLAILLGVNCRPIHVPRDPDAWKYDSLAGPWLGDSRTVYGWPFAFIRVFDQPSEINAEARFDPLALSVNALAWLVCVGCGALPWIALRSARNKGERASG